MLPPATPTEGAAQLKSRGSWFWFPSFGRQSQLPATPSSGPTGTAAAAAAAAAAAVLDPSGLPSSLASSGPPSSLAETPPVYALSAANPLASGARATASVTGTATPFVVPSSSTAVAASDAKAVAAAAAVVATTLDKDGKKKKVYTAPKYAKTLYLTPAQLAKLGLHDGLNTAHFSFASKLQGKTVLSCGIFLWNHDDKIVVSDIDGTITKSDVMGHGAAFFGLDWTHLGVAKLYTAIANNGCGYLRHEIFSS
jgi:phosphatidate phosphatase LPIN